MSRQARTAILLCVKAGEVEDDFTDSRPCLSLLELPLLSQPPPMSPVTGAMLAAPCMMKCKPFCDPNFCKSFFGLPVRNSDYVQAFRAPKARKKNRISFGTVREKKKGRKNPGTEQVERSSVAAL
jgi:hypothetical protein